MNNSLFTRRQTVLALAGMLALPAAMAQASLTTKPITFIVPFAAGSASSRSGVRRRPRKPSSAGSR